MTLASTRVLVWFVAARVPSAHAPKQEPIALGTFPSVSSRLLDFGGFLVGGGGSSSDADGAELSRALTVLQAFLVLPGLLPEFFGVGEIAVAFLLPFAAGHLLLAPLFVIEERRLFGKHFQAVACENKL